MIEEGYFRHSVEFVGKIGDLLEAKSEELTATRRGS